MPARRRTSAGLLPLRVTGSGEIEAFIGHMGGPFWARKNERAWSIIKGEFDPEAEAASAAAEREWVEETGAPVPDGEWFDLGSVTQSGGKKVYAFAIVTTADVVLRESNTVSMEWPPRSGRQVTFPEIDRAEWVPARRAAELLVAAQAEFIERVSRPMGPATGPVA